MTHPARAGRSSLTLLLLLIAAVAAAGWWAARTSSAGEAEPADVQRIGAVSGAAESPAEENAVANPPSSLASPVAATGTGSRFEASEGDAVVAAPVRFDAARLLRGRLVHDEPLPADESLTVFVEIWGQGGATDEDLSVLDRFSYSRGGRPWVEVAKVEPMPDGRFEAPRPVGVSMIRLRVDGDYVAYGEKEFTVDGEDDPGDTSFEVSVGWGAHVTFTLGGEVASAVQDGALADGATVEFSSTGPSDSRIGFSGTPYSLKVGLDSRGRGVVRGVQSYDWSISDTDGDERDPALAPFRIPLGFSFEPEAGQRVAIEIPLVRGVAFEGRVLGAGEEPIAGARVKVESPYGSGGRGRRFYHQETDQDGTFRYGALPSEWDEVTVEAKGYLDEHWLVEDVDERNRAGEPRDFQLALGRSVALRILTPDGLPAQGLPVTAIVGGDAKNRVRQQTDKNGCAALVGLVPGDVEIVGMGRLRPSAQMDSGERVRFLAYEGTRGFGGVKRVDSDKESLWTFSLALSDAEVDAGAGGEIEVQLRRGPTVHGRVTGANAAWPDPVRLFIFSAAGDNDFPGRMMMRSLRGDGTYEVDPASGVFSGQLAPGSYIAVAVSGEERNGIPDPDAPRVHTSPDVPFTVGTEDVEVTVSFGGSQDLSGTVLSEGGASLAGVTVRLSRHEGWHYSMKEQTRTDEAGEFRFETVRPGEYIVSAVDGHYQADNPARFTVTEGQPLGAVELVLKPAGGARIAVLDVSGELLPEASAGLRKIDGSTFYGRPVADDDEWEGAIGSMAPGEYFAVFGQELTGGRRVLLRRRFAVKAGEVTDVTLQCVEDGTVEVAGLVTSGGEPASGVTVVLRDAYGVVASGQTDEEGRYALLGLQDGTMTLHCGPNEYVRVREREVTIMAGESTLPILDLPSGAIQGVSEAPFGLATTPAVFAAGALPDAKPIRTAGSVSNGRFTILYLPDGEYIVASYERATGLRSDKTEAVTVEIVGGKAVRGVLLKKR